MSQKSQSLAPLDYNLNLNKKIYLRIKVCSSLDQIKSAIDRQKKK